eukprot:TRINITY_DN3669_c0_g2_i5.p1 TRINITY_DN3669_c0_g2~~TRINITY_DN3669_c0_g2_i5.p1  ORF type:complete len:282 (-),score=65.89 TRINITY_DN3669_c0_g2_i5:408-1253(-)
MLNEATEEHESLLVSPYAETFHNLTSAPVAALPLCRVKKPIFVGEGINSYITYEVHTQGHTVIRRYSDFLWLNERLQEENLDVLVPPVPEKVIVARFTQEVVDYRRRQLEKFLSRILTHPVLSKSQFLNPFLTLDEMEMQKHKNNVKVYVNPKVEEKSFFETAGSFFSGLTGTVEPAKEVDLYFEEKKIYLDGLTQRLSLVQDSVDGYLEIQREVVDSLNQFSFVSGLLSSKEADVDTALARLWKNYSELMKDLYSVRDDLLNAENQSIGDGSPSKPLQFS